MADPPGRRAHPATGRAGAELARPHHTPRTLAEKGAREARLAAEMRANLRKRKRQQRARDGAGRSDDG
jgi:hypothetical protein